MRAAICRAYGPPETLAVENVPDPVAGAGEVLVAVHAAAVNFPDLLILANRYQISVAPPFIPGSEVAGRVEAVGDGVGGLQIGDLIFGQTMIGGFAERVLLPAAGVTKLSVGADTQIAAAFAVVYGTAYHALRSIAELKKGETLLVLGAGGGVGLATVDVGRQLGARVIAAASSAEKLAVCREYGAAETIDYVNEDLKQRAKAITGGRGVDVVIDPVGGSLAEPALRATAWRGRYVSVGYASGEIPRIPLNLLLLKGSLLTGFTIGGLMANAPEEAERNRAELLELFLQGRLRPRISAVYSLADVARALRDVAERRAIGKVIIDPRLG